MPTEVKVSGAWQTLKNVYVKYSGSWRDCKEVYVKEGGVWRSVFIKPIINSLSLDGTGNEYLQRDNVAASTGVGRIFTFSFWVKSSDNTSYIFSAGSTGSTKTSFIFSTFSGNNNLRYESEKTTVPTSFYDVKRSDFNINNGAWNHVVFRVDTNDATAANRVKMYVNGVEATTVVGVDTPPPSGHQNYISSSIHDWSIGREIGVAGTNAFAGNLADVIFVDGQSLAPTEFGISSGTWIPKVYTGTYGAGGFHLKFQDSANLGLDSQGGNSFTQNGIDATNQSTDAPS